MTENYKPKKIVTLYDVAKHNASCPNCHQVMGREIHGNTFWCFNDKCRLFDVKYKAVKTLVTMER